MSCDNCLDRRGFLTHSALAAAAALLAASCGDGQIGSLAPGATENNQETPGGNGVKVKVSTLAGLATVGQPVVVGDRRAAVRVKAGTAADSFIAVSMICTHQHTTVNVVGTGYECPNHGSTFAADGTNIFKFDPKMPPLAKLSAVYDAASDTLTVS